MPPKKKLDFFCVQTRLYLQMCVILQSFFQNKSNFFHALDDSQKLQLRGTYIEITILQVHVNKGFSRNIQVKVPQITYK